MNRIPGNEDKTWHTIEEFLEVQPVYFKQAIKKHEGRCALTNAEIDVGDLIMFTMFCRPNEEDTREVELPDGQKVSVPDLDIWVDQINVDAFLESDVREFYRFAKNDSKAISLLSMTENL